jgi:hypothetical protein
LISSKREEADASSLFFCLFPFPQRGKCFPQAEIPTRKELQRKKEGIFLSTNSTRTEVAARQIGIIYIRKKYSDNNTLI